MDDDNNESGRDMGNVRRAVKEHYEHRSGPLFLAQLGQLLPEPKSDSPPSMPLH
ncbi:MAG: hypothetical protein IPI67_26840 [Myxococcales bacterium]|nr:hypothetical protein [Myxococcales bacterium]